MDEQPLTCNNSLQGIGRDLLTDILGRVDGVGLASVCCTCSDLREMAHEDQSLWKQLCHSTWPSTALGQAQNLITASSLGDFGKFFAQSYPLVAYDQAAAGDHVSAEPQVSPSDFVSLVDVYWKNKCVMSKVLDCLPEAVDPFWQKLAGSDTQKEEWFLNFPFKLELLSNKHDDHEEEDEIDEVQTANNEDDENIATSELIDDLRLSWILLDKKGGKAVNLSSWKPLMVQRRWPYEGDYTAHFGCAVAVEESVLPHKLAKCIIKASFKMTEREGSLQWMGISLGIEDITGAHVNGRKSLMILNQALHSLRSTNQVRVEKGIQEYERQKNEMNRQRRLRETLVDGLFVSVEVAIFCHFFSSFLIS